MYWNTDSRVNVVTDNTGRNRWETIKRYLHFTDNTKHLANCNDKLFKIWSLIDNLTTFFNNVPMDNFISVDKQVIHFIGKPVLKT